MKRDPQRRLILVVDDDPDVQELIRVALTADGYSVASAASGRDVLDYLRSNVDVEAIVLDLMLPDLDGAEFRRIQLRDRSLAWIPVIVMSAAIEADRVARDVHAAAFLRKPLDLDELRRAAAIVISKSRVRGARAVELATGELRTLSSA